MKILLADDHAILRSGLRRILEAELREAAIGEAGSAAELLERVRSESWDLVVLDISMPGRSGLDVLPELRKLRPAMRVLVLSMFAEEQFALRAFRAGASGYLTKERAPDELIRAVRTILAGRRFVGEALADRLVGRLAFDQPGEPHEALSPRELEVFLRIARARTVSEIAEEMGLSVKTVSTYRARILEKMNLASNAELMQYALRKGLVE